MSIAAATPTALEHFAALHATFAASRRGDPEWLRVLRASAMERLQRIGFPHMRQEAWRFTDVRPLLKTPWQPAPEADLAPEHEARFDTLSFEGLDSHLFIVINGRMAAHPGRHGSLPKGVRIRSLADALSGSSDINAVEIGLGQIARDEENPFLALNTAFVDDGAVIEIPRGVAVEEPIHILHLAIGDQPAVIHPRTLVLVGEEAEATIIESYAGLDSTQAQLTNAVTEISLGAGANVKHLKLQRESPAAFHIATCAIHQGRDSNLFSNNITIGAALARNDVRARIDGEGAHCALDGLNLLGGNQHVDNHTLLDHAQPHCTSHQLYKSILDGTATNVFNGRIIVRPDAQKTDAIQSNRNLLLSDDATAHSQPNLEIFADDVKCTHGATVGNVDDEAVFYLQSRGIGLGEARGLLTYAFANEIIAEITVAPVREQLEQIIYERYHHGREAQRTP